jgi:hypothetical protein
VPESNETRWLTNLEHSWNQRELLTYDACVSDECGDQQTADLLGVARGRERRHQLVLQVVGVLGNELVGVDLPDAGLEDDTYGEWSALPALYLNS